MDTDPNIKTHIKYTGRDKYMSTQTLDLQRTHMGNFGHLIHKHHKSHSHSRTHTHAPTRTRTENETYAYTHTVTHSCFHTL